MAKEWAKAFYNSGAWKDARDIALKRDRYMCQNSGCHNTAEEVHHIVELKPANINDTRVTLNLNNLTSLCGECHKKITKAMHSKSRNSFLPDIEFDDNGYPVPIAPRGDA